MSTGPGTDADALLAKLDSLDAIVTAKGFPARSPWWKAEIDRFLRSGRRRWIIRAGRRSGKSTTLCRLAVGWALWGSWSVPLGDTPVIAIASISKDEAAQRLKTIADLLTSLGVEYERRGDEIETLRGVVFKVFAATIKAVGFTSILVLCDEVSRWESKDTGANPAREVISGLAPTMATVPSAFMVLSSSPWARDDYHNELFEQSDTDFQLCSFAATWTAHPELTEERCKQLEPDEKTRAREYGAIPSDARTANWFGDACLARAFVADIVPEPYYQGVRYWVSADVAFSEGGDRFGWSVTSYQVNPDRLRPAVLRVHETGAWKADREPREMALRLRNEVCARYGETRVVADQHEQSSWKQLARDVGLEVTIVPWTGGDGIESKTQRFRAVRASMLGSQMILPADPTLLAEFKSVYSELSPSGNEIIKIPRNALGHGDRCSSIVLGASCALARAPQLAVARMTEMERMERAANERAFTECFSGQP